MNIDELLDIAYMRGYSDGWRECQEDKLKLKVFNDKENCAIILNLIQRNYNVSMEQLQSRSRKRDIVIPRQLAMFLLKTYTRITLVEIGKMFGDRDHTTVIHSADTIKDLLATGNIVAADLLAIQAKAMQLMNNTKPLDVPERKEKKIYVPPAPKLKKKIFTPEELGIKVEVPKKIKQEIKPIGPRPPAEYSNNGYLKLTNQLNQPIKSSGE